MSEISTMKDVKLPGKIKVKDVVVGKIVEIKEKYVLVDVNYFTEGKIYLEHFTQDKTVNNFFEIVKLNDEVTCEVTKVDEENGIILLTRMNQIRKENFSAIQGKVESKDNVIVEVKKAINKGFIVAYNGFEFFLPESQVENCQVGQKLEVRIMEIDERKRSGVVSRRVIEREIYQENRAKEIDKIQVGDVLKGVVTQVENYGAFVKFEYNQGLLKFNQLSHIFIDKIQNAIKVGDEIEVKVIKKENGRLELSRKALLLTPYEEYAKEHKVGETVKAKVAQKMPFGVILQLNEHVTGLLHTSEFSWNPNDNLMASLKFGDTLEVAILAMDSKKEKISLSKKALIDNPWSRVTAKQYDEVEATVTAVNSKGLVVSCLGVDGFIPAGELVFEGNSSKVEDYYSVGDLVKGTIIDINPREWKLVVSVKKYHNKVEREQFEKYMSTQTEEAVNTTLGDLFKNVLKK